MRRYGHHPPRTTVPSVTIKQRALLSPVVAEQPAELAAEIVYEAVYMMLYSHQWGYRSEDLGASWVEVATGGAHVDFLFEPFQTLESQRIISAGTGSGLIVSISDDLGETWSSASLDQGPSSAFFFSSVSTDGAGNWIIGGVDSGNNSCVNYSNDDGATWTYAQVNSTFNDTANNRYGGGNFYLIDYGGDLWLSSDLGQTWALQGNTGNSAGVLEYVPTTGRLLSGLDDLRSSDDNGGTWAVENHPAGVAGVSINQIVANADGSLIIAACTDFGTGDRYACASSDNGENWTQTVTGNTTTPSNGHFYITDWRPSFDPVNNQFFAYAKVRVAGVWKHGQAISADGINWTVIERSALTNFDRGALVFLRPV